MRSSHVPTDGDYAVFLLLTIASLVAGVLGFYWTAQAEYDRCAHRYTDRTLERLQELCGRRP